MSSLSSLHSLSESAAAAASTNFSSSASASSKEQDSIDTKVKLEAQQILPYKFLIKCLPNELFVHIYKFLNAKDMYHFPAWKAISTLADNSYYFEMIMEKGGIPRPEIDAFRSSCIATETQVSHVEKKECDGMIALRTPTLKTMLFDMLSMEDHTALSFSFLETMFFKETIGPQKTGLILPHLIKILVNPPNINALETSCHILVQVLLDNYSLLESELSRETTYLASAGQCLRRLIKQQDRHLIELAVVARDSLPIDATDAEIETALVALSVDTKRVLEATKKCQAELDFHFPFDHVDNDASFKYYWDISHPEDLDIDFFTKCEASFKWMFMEVFAYQPYGLNLPFRQEETSYTEIEAIRLECATMLSVAFGADIEKISMLDLEAKLLDVALKMKDDDIDNAEARIILSEIAANQHASFKIQRMANYYLAFLQFKSPGESEKDQLAFGIFENIVSHPKNLHILFVACAKYYMAAMIAEKRINGDGLSRIALSIMSKITSNQTLYSLPVPQFEEEIRCDANLYFVSLVMDQPDHTVYERFAIANLMKDRILEEDLVGEKLKPSVEKCKDCLFADSMDETLSVQERSLANHYFTRLDEILTQPIENLRHRDESSQNE